jgi:hypothetical protein
VLCRMISIVFSAKAFCVVFLFCHASFRFNHSVFVCSDIVRPLYTWFIYLSSFHINTVRQLSCIWGGYHDVIFCDVTLCSLVEVCRRFGGKYYSHL